MNEQNKSEWYREFLSRFISEVHLLHSQADKFEDGNYFILCAQTKQIAVKENEEIRKLCVKKVAQQVYGH